MCFVFAQMRVVTFNVHKRDSTRSHPEVQAYIKQLLASCDADVICIQESSGSCLSICPDDL